MSLDVYSGGILLPVSSLKPCPTEPVNRDTIVQKRFYSQFVPFIHYRGKTRKSSVTEVETAYGKKDDLLVAGRSGVKDIEDLNVFFRPFLSAPSVIFFFTFQGKKLSSL